MFNKVIIVGNLTRDVEKRYLPSGIAMSLFGLASTHRFNKQDGSKADETCFVDVKIFGRSAEVAEQYLHKGSRVLIEGRLVYESWVDQSGAKRSRHSILCESMKMLDRKADSQGQGGGEYAEQNQGYYNQSQPYSNQPYSQPQASKTYQQAPQGQSGGNGYEQNIPSIDINDDDIPF
ncbi:single-stranded DNA-binding protein [Helicobacter sp.]|uniref:single-stranded DNA-binding protein n=1 Tax=Helicobacter sp. TaxID=218 RepID=UPI0025B95411|nr:single-stranded DNA-binding protein [Helicobacter sp.]MBR2494242.1 single-stranded DNA-binding protein [Helicobacter sp.]